MNIVTITLQKRVMMGLLKMLNQTRVCSKESTCTECNCCFRRSRLDSEFEDLQGVKKC